jgi:hypothetical protein
MPKFVPEVDFRLLVIASQKAFEMPGAGSSEVIKTALGAVATPEQMFTVEIRMGTLAKLLRSNPDLKPWLIESGAVDALMDEAIFKAAARAPLEETKTLGDLAFDSDAFKKILLEESRTEGSA